MERTNFNVRDVKGITKNNGLSIIIPKDNKKKLQELKEMTGLSYRELMDGMVDFLYKNRDILLNFDNIYLIDQ